MKRASIDIGSNSVLLFVGQAQADGSFACLRDEARVTALGKGLDKTGMFAEQMMQETFSVLQEYAEIVKQCGVMPQDVLVAATEASRVAKNSQPFFDKIRREIGFNIQIISGKAEAFFSAKGVIGNHQLDKKSESLLIDIGGASTELIIVHPEPFKITDTVSLKVGSVRMTDWRKEGSLDRNLEQIVNKCALKSYQRFESAIGVAGTMTSLAAMLINLPDYDARKIDHFKLESGILSDLLLRLEKMSVEEILKHYPILGKRAETIYAGAYLVVKLMESLGLKYIETSTFGLRHGLAIEGKVYEDSEF